MKLSLDADIIPSESLGGIRIGEDIDVVIHHLEEENIPFAHSTFVNLGQSFRRLSISDEAISLVADESGNVVRVWCTESYKGSCKSYLRPGMTVGEVVACTEKQMIIHGVLVVDGEFGAGFNVPDQYEGRFYDDVDSADDLPSDMPLRELHVMDREWWR